jgi:hypothetical protein
LIAELTSYEAEHGPLGAVDVDDDPASGGVAPDEGEAPPEGGFKL